MRSLTTLLAALGLTSSALAHEREFTRSRDWHLPYAGEHEFELRSFFDTTHGDFRGQLEYEYGVTSHFAFEPGLEIREKEDGDYEVEAAELELRFNLGEFRQDAWLPALNVEYEHPFENEESDRVEFKGVLSRYGERDDFTVNLNFGQELEDERENESELTAGWLRRLAATENGETKLGLGLEAVQDFEADHLQAGPLLTWRASQHFHFLTSYAAAIDERGDGNADLLTLIVEWEP